MTIHPLSSQLQMLKTEFSNLNDFDRSSMDNRAFFVNLYQLMEKIQPNSSESPQ